MGKKRYRIGIDVGQRGVGLFAAQIDNAVDALSAKPVKVLNSVVYWHDGGVYDERTKETRKAHAGAVRRAARRIESRKKTLKELDDCLAKLGFPVDTAKEIVANASGGSDPLLPWNARRVSLKGYIEQDSERALAITIAVRHIARHRGWRNPYAGVDSLARESAEPSPFMNDLIARANEWLERRGEPRIELWDNRPTQAVVIGAVLAVDPAIKLRGSADSAEDGFMIGKLHQSDIFYELSEILRIQRIAQDDADEILKIVFSQKSPRSIGAAASLVGKDDLQPEHPRASKASLAFQRYRILSTLSNLRVSQDGQNRPLDIDEINRLYEMLSSESAALKGVTWIDVSDALGIERAQLKGVGGETADGEPISAKNPPVVNTYAELKKLWGKSKQLKEWWSSASDNAREAYILQFDNAGVPEFYQEYFSEELETIDELLASLDDASQEALEGVDIASGRASYGIDTLNRLSKRMLETGFDVHQARKDEFGVEDNWKPSPNPLGTPTGNQSVDRVIKYVARWIKDCIGKWGIPETINIEHGRDGFKSARVANEMQQTQNRRYKKNEEIAGTIREVLESLNVSVNAQIKSADIRRMKAIERQNCQCLYCGAPINFITAEMDHIVPRKGVGSSNTIDNLVAVCGDCNKRKSNTLFSKWATKEMVEEAISRVKLMAKDQSFSPREFKDLQQRIIARLKQKEEDEPMDTRSIESVSWMARELRNQIEGYVQGLYAGQDCTQLPGKEICHVFNGRITSSARKASGIERAIPWIGGGTTKNRLDRRHHAIDAAIICFMRSSVAKVLVQRDELRRANEDLRSRDNASWLFNWRDYNGVEPGEIALYKTWRESQMPCLKDILIDQMAKEKIPILRDKRLRIQNGEAHKATVERCDTKHVGDALSVTAINKASSRALWTALVNHPDYDPVEGLPQDHTRVIRVNGKVLNADDEIDFLAPRGKADLDDGVAYLKVRGGVVSLGGAVHHLRFYRVRNGANGKTKYYLLRVYQVDLLSCSGDLFHCELPPSSITRRFAPPKLREALEDDSAIYLGWAVTGDEIHISPSCFRGRSNAFGTFLSVPEFANTTKFYLAGNEDLKRLTLRPLDIAAEGIQAYLETSGKELTEEQKKAVKDIIAGKGWRVTVDDLMQSNPTIIRRNTLGYVRWRSGNHMPTSWSPDKHGE